MKFETIINILLPAFIWLLIGCSGTNEENNSENQNTEFNQNGWQLQKQVTKEIGNLSFTFPSAGYAYDNRRLLKNVLRQLKVIAHYLNCQITPIS